MSEFEFPVLSPDLQISFYYRFVAVRDIVADDIQELTRRSVPC
jgi:hypothetical protein